jgi:sulfite reductase alpha subunit-like flavoprotein
MEEVYVLYGSQTGNSEQAAKEFCESLKKRNKITTQVQPKHMQLDDFLELEYAKWTRLVVIFVSSYGVGQAPLGSYRFRELCEAWIEEPSPVLEGLSYALCGLGDSKYTTFFKSK